MRGATTDEQARPTFGSGTGAAAPPAPPPGPAIDHAPTLAALARHGRRALVALGGGLAAGVVAGVVAAATDWQGRRGNPLVGVALAGPAIAVWLGYRWWWMRRVLRSSPWVARRGQYHVVMGRRYRTNRAVYATLVLEADEHGPEVQCAVPELRWRMDALAAPGGPVDVWVAGDPTRKAVATRGGSDVVPIARRRWGWWRDRMARKIAQQRAG